MISVKAAFTTTMQYIHQSNTYHAQTMRMFRLYHTSISKIYKHLNHSNNEIRVIRIKPGRWEDNISCRLEVVSLDRFFKPRYDTLSYTWGSSADPKQITVNQQDVAISTNLFTALRALRRKHRTVTIWADALCIDQSNNDEKSTQVALMGRIYKQCRQTWVSLGCPDNAWADGAWSPPSRLPEKLGLLKQFVRRAWRALWHHIVLRRSRASRLGVNHISDALRLMQSTQSDPDVDEPSHQDVNQATSMLTWLATNGYWSRVWIAQEIALSRVDPICLFGKHQVPLLSLDTVFSNWSDGGFLSSPEAQRQRAGWGPTVSQGIARAQEICMLRDEYLSMRLSIRALHLTGSIKLPRILQLASHRHATVPHDYVYGLRSLLPSKDQAALLPDYNLSIRDLYASATRLLLHREYSATLLCAAMGTSPENAHKLPSWSLDFSKPLRLPIGSNSANTNSPHEDPPVDNTSVLHLHGTRLAGSITTSVPYSYLSAELGASPTVATFIQDDIYARDMRMDNAYDEPCSPTPTPDNTHFFMTSNTVLGKCTNSVQPGDELWTFDDDDASVIFVLRPEEDVGGETGQGKRRYKLVGPCAMLRVGESGEDAHAGNVGEDVQIV